MSLQLVTLNTLLTTRERNKAAKRCKGWFPNDIELQKGCTKYARSLSGQEAKGFTKDGYLSQIDQNAFFYARGYDANPNDSLDFELPESDVNPMIYIGLFLIIIVLIYLIWQR